MEKKIDLNKSRKKNYYSRNKHNIKNYSTANNNAQQQSNDAKTDNEEQVNDQITAEKTVSNFINKRKSSKDNGKTEFILKQVIKRKTISIILIILGIFILLFLPLFVILLLAGGSGSSFYGIGMATDGYYQPECTEITVKFVDNNNYEVTGASTYSMKDYVAGVLAAEVAGAHNIEVYKTFAIAARTYALRNEENCSIESSSRKQNFKDVMNDSSDYVKMIYQAVEETEGIVLLEKNSTLFSAQYDAFCYVDKNNNYYTLSQKNQKIPVYWVENNVSNYYYKNCPCNLNDKSMTQCWSSNGIWQDGGHGNGMSQIGAYYLGRELNYTYDQILDFYYGDSDVTLSKKSFTSSIAGLDIKTTTTASYTLSSPINDYLSLKGSNLENYNDYIRNNVENAGVGTREGVVTAAVSMINYLYDNFDTKLPYYWGGNSQAIGVPPEFGNYKQSPVSRGGNVNYYKSFDCSGFVSWAIRNGGYNFSRKTTTGFDDAFSDDSCIITDASCIGQPGDLINSRGCHVQMIVSVDEESSNYYVAESTGNLGVVMRQWNMHSGNCEGITTKILHMDSFYSDNSNVDTSY